MLVANAATPGRRAQTRPWPRYWAPKLASSPLYFRLPATLILISHGRKIEDYLVYAKKRLLNYLKHKYPHLQHQALRELQSQNQVHNVLLMIEPRGSQDRNLGQEIIKQH
jgi:hypothetical protein